MTATLADVNARARGLQTHLLPAEALRRLAAARSLPALVAELARHGYPLDGGAVASVPALDQVIGEVAAARLGLLARWLGRREGVARALFERLDLAALRALARGAAEGAAPAARLRGVIATPRLPARLLEQLAAADSHAAFHRILARAGHPAAEAIGATATRPGHLDLLEVELALRRWWAARVTAGARRAGREARDLARTTIDRENLAALLLASAWGVELAPDAAFLVGGQRLERERFLALAREPDTERLRQALATRFRGTPAGPLLADAGIPLGALAGRLLAADIRAAHGAARQAPLGLAPLVEVVLRIEAEAHDLRRIVHALALDAPPAVAVAGLVAAA